MADLIIQEIEPFGTEIAFVAADSEGDTAPYNEDLVIVVKNDDDADITVTLESATFCNQGFLHHEEILVEAGESRYIGNIPLRYRGTSGRVSWTYDSVDDVMVAALLA